MQKKFPDIQAKFLIVIYSHCKDLQNTGKYKKAVTKFYFIWTTEWEKEGRHHTHTHLHSWFLPQMDVVTRTIPSQMQAPRAPSDSPPWPCTWAIICTQKKAGSAAPLHLRRDSASQTTAKPAAPQCLFQQTYLNHSYPSTIIAINPMMYSSFCVSKAPFSLQNCYSGLWNTSFAYIKVTLHES